MKAGTNTFYNSGRKLSSALVLVLAILLLVVSCPLKRFLQSNAGSSISLQTGIKAQTTASTRYKPTSCCSAKKKTVLVEAAKSNQTNISVDFPAICNHPSGFAIHHYLSSAGEHIYPYGSIKISSLPLFLLHRRLLI